MDEEVDYWIVRYFTDTHQLGKRSIYTHNTQKEAMSYADSLIEGSPGVNRVLVEMVMKPRKKPEKAPLYPGRIAWPSNTI